MRSKGIVYLVGAGPGDPGLLTRRGAELLQRAEVVVYDGLVNAALLHFARPQAEIIYGGKHDRLRAVPQTELNALLVDRARSGKCVVRLKAGDPYVLGRGGEEAAHLATAGIPFEVVSGVSSAEAALNYAGIPLTHRDYCSSFTVVTGHEDPARQESRLDWARLAKVPGTLVVLMGLKHLRAIAASLVEHGRSAQTPAALIRWATTGRQQVLTGTLDTLADQADREQLAPPAVIVIGEVVTLRSQLNWFENQPLFGQRIVATQPRDQAGPLVHLLGAAGAEVLEVPAFAFAPPSDPQPLRAAASRAGEYDWILFSHPVSVAAFFDRFFQVHQDWRDLGGARLGAYGSQTAAKLQELHLRVDAIPSEHQGPQLAVVLAKHGDLRGQRLLLVRPEGANPDVPKYLQSLGALVEDVAGYRMVAETEDAAGFAARLVEKGADWIVFAGYPEVKFLNERFALRSLAQRQPQLKWASIGPKTSQQLVSLGLSISAEAASPTLEALVAALENSVK